jgi:hypothetical protein
MIRQRREYWVAAILFLVVLVLRILYAAHYRIDSDEHQHLHVVWGWTKGMIPYRDYFDNHAPLFQALVSPFFGWLGERADIVVPMRLLMILPFGLSVFLVGKIGSMAFSARTGLWAAVFSAVCFRFFFVSTEFRPDDLWALLWFTAIFVAISGDVPYRLCLVVGLLGGVAFCVSMKTVLMVFAMAAASIIIIILRAVDDRAVPWQRIALSVALLLFGLALYPVLTVLFFRWHSALTAMYNCVILHNLVADPKTPPLYLRLLKWAALLVVPVAASILIYRRSKRDEKLTRAVWLFLVAIFYYITLKALWPEATAEDYLPSDPLFMIFLAAAVLAVAKFFRERLRVPEVVLPLVLAAAGITWIVRSQSPFNDATVDKIGQVKTALMLTQPDEYVMDSKGETIFRRRPFYYVLEGMTGIRMKAGLIKDTIPERLVSTETPLATVHRMPPRAAGFIRQNYLPIAFRLSVLGQLLPMTSDDATCEIRVPSTYTIVSEKGPFAGTLNGEPFTGPMRLESGIYRIHRDGGSGALAIIWSRAIEKGFSPFAPLKRDIPTPQD